MTALVGAGAFGLHTGRQQPIGRENVKSPQTLSGGDDRDRLISMKVQIHSFDELKSGVGERPKGKTHSVNSTALKLSVEQGALVVRASETDPGSSVLENPAATTPVRQITREATIRFTPEDLKALVAAALAQNLVVLNVVVPPTGTPAR